MEDAYEVITQYVKAEELIQVKDEYRGKDGKVNMCQALKELTECNVSLIWEVRRSMK